jgi:hypothetical protein
MSHRQLLSGKKKKEEKRGFQGISVSKNMLKIGN